MNAQNSKLKLDLCALPISLTIQPFYKELQLNFDCVAHLSSLISGEPVLGPRKEDIVDEILTEGRSCQEEGEFSRKNGVSNNGNNERGKFTKVAKQQHDSDDSSTSRFVFSLHFTCQMNSARLNTYTDVSFQ